VTLDALRAELDAGAARSAYLVVGEEPLLRDDAVASIQKRVLEDAVNDFDLDRIDGDTATPAALLDAVGTLPVLAPRRLVIVREPEAGRGKSKVADTIVEALAVVGAASDTVLVVVAARVDARSRWVKAFDKDAVVRCDPPRAGRALESFVKYEAKRQGVALDRAAVTLLAERTGPLLLILRQEIAKAGLFVEPGQKVTAEHVAVATSDVAEERVWDLTDAIGEARQADALVHLSKLLRAGGAPPAILGALVNHFRKLLQVRAGGTVSGAPFAVRKLQSQAKRFTPGRLLSCLGAIHQTDLALKGAGGVPPDLAMERLVIGLSS
jgi:DNA polymerase-3 subunit delta